MKPRESSFGRWLPRCRRKKRRQLWPRLVAHYWTGSAPTSTRVRDISSTELYLLTDERWYPGTMLKITLQRTDCAVEDPERAISVNARVVQWDAEGVRLEFVLSRGVRQAAGECQVDDAADQQMMAMFLATLSQSNDELLVDVDAE